MHWQIISTSLFCAGVFVVCGVISGLKFLGLQV